MKNKLRIAQIAPLWIPIPPITYGGIELMLSVLTEELVARGHDITLFASGDSKTKAKTVFPTPKGIWLQHELKSPHAIINVLLKKVYRRISNFDLIHNHFDFFAFPLVMIKDRPPILTTIHRPLNHAYMEAIKSCTEIKFCTIYQDQKRHAEENGIAITDVVYNGIDLSCYEFNDEPEDYLLFIGRLNEEKGILDALEIAKKSSHRIIVAGNVVGAKEWSYFMSEVQPRLNEDKVRFVGRIGFKEKIELFKNAKALLFPVDRREPFGLVMIEAMACGTPVIGYKRGSVPEVIEDGKTGFIVNDQDEMVEALKKIDTIKREDCRARVEQHFNLDMMVSGYERLYKKIIHS